MITVSVILPVYNCELYIKEAVDSVLNQTFSDFELIIIDDCSTDSTMTIVKSYKDSRIKLIEKEKNSGYTDSLNMAIKLAKGKYIARMDGDDICLPERFQIQVKFLEDNPEIILCGGAIQIIGTEEVLQHPSNYDEIKVKLCFGNSFYHPTIMAKKEILLENSYDKNFEPAEDYDLWTRLVSLGELANLEEVLLLYRFHENQISNLKSNYQITVGYASQYRMFLSFNLNYDKKVYEIMHRTFKIQEKYSFIDFKNSLHFLNSLQKANEKSEIYNKTIFRDKIQNIKINYIKTYYNKSKISIFNMMTYLKYITLSEIFKIVYKRINKKNEI